MIPGTYDKLLEEQQYKCACCGTTRVGKKSGRFHVDHNHITNKVRGLLCSECNAGLGKLGDSVEGIKKALAYLLRTDGG